MYKRYLVSFEAMEYPRVPMASLCPSGGNEAIIEETFKQKRFFFKKTFVCHSFRIINIPCVILSFLPNYCHSFRIIVIPSVSSSFLPDYCHSFRIIVILSVLLSFFPNYCHSFRIIVIPSELFPFQIFVILNSSCTLPYPKGETIAIFAIFYKFRKVRTYQFRCGHAFCNQPYQQLHPCGK